MTLQHALAPAPHPQMQDLKNQVQDHADQAMVTVLHDQLLAAQAQHLHQSHPHPHSHAHHAPPPPRPTPGASAASPRDQTNSNNANTANITIDPAIAGPSAMIHPPPTAAPTAAQGQAPGSDMSMEEHTDGRKTYGKRELSTSKRAAQNRAAQRAFRQRKEGYIRKLEEQVKDYELLVENYKAIQAENYQLREYIISLQSRLIDSQNEVPELPGNIDLSQPRNDPPAPAINAATTSAGGAAGNVATTAAGGAGAGGGDQAEVNALNRIAVAGLGMRKHQHEEAAFLGNNTNDNTAAGNNANVGGANLSVNNGNVNVNPEADSPSKRMRFDGLPDVGMGVGLGDGIKGDVTS
ncbi:hypothetical protein GX51_07053 [Blastomyces parvus]|uniref:Putative transcription factor kapC n=1 Tax=Blastomyces parvus TaxID=2060905 RepID=A0A2B7WN60_9EURO|nr:hypothetical protein GX51_07053 [Blastomyces parvus]